MEILVVEKLDMIQHRAFWQCELTVKKAYCILGCIKRSMASRLRNAIVPLYSTLVRFHHGYCAQLWDSQNQKDMHLLEHVQRRAMKIIRGLENLSCGA